MVRRLSIALAVVLLSALPASGEVKGFVKPTPEDKCSVCGMFVAKYPDWLAELVFQDGSYAVFDGPKDLFKYFFDRKQYDPSRVKLAVTALLVTDYYAVKPIDGFTAWYVLGSDVYGPMGKELVPFAQESDAREFLKDHKGQKILRFREITQDVMKALE